MDGSAAAGPPPDRPEASPLRARLRAAADRSGELRFDRFMEIALYAPEGGYYARPDLTFDGGGDFYTAPAVAPLFGWAVAERLLAAWRLQGAPRRYRIVELGPGDGTLAGDILEHLGRRLGPAAGGFSYELADRSSPRAEAAYRRAAGRAGAIALGLPPRTGAATPFPGAVIANEVLDAFPCRRFVARGGRWFERYVDVAAGVGTERPVDRPDLPAPEEGAELEVADGAAGLVRSWADRLTDGLLLLLDYGGPAGNGGRATLQSLRGHRTGRDLLEDPGRQDLSAWVDFPRIRAAARRAGFLEVAFRSQAEALTDWGLGDLARPWIAAAADPVERVRRHLAVKNLLFGFPNFQVLELAAGALARASAVPAPPVRAAAPGADGPAGGGRPATGMRAR